MDLETIPQFSGTCWFNAIINIMLFSKNLRKVIKNNFKGKRKTPNDKFFNFLIYMLRNSGNREKIRRVYEDFNNLNLKVEYLLISYLKMYDVGLYENIKSDLLYQHYDLYLFNILNSYKINYLDLYLNKDILLVDKYNKIRDIKTEIDNIDLLIVSYKIPLKYNIDELDKDSHTESKMKLKRGIKNFTTTFYNQIKNKENIINLNQYSYKLDCCIFENNSEYKPNGQHAISGITYKNDDLYIIDSINIDYDYKERKGAKKKIKKLVPCKPININWKSLDFDFCINEKCGVYKTTKKDIQEKNLCYNFNNNFLICIYVKVKDESPDKKMIDTVIETPLESKDIKYNTKEISKLIKNDIYTKLKSYSNKELIVFILNTIVEYNSYDYYLNEIKKKPLKYRYLYEKTTNKKFNSKMNNKEIIRELYLNLIYNYLKNGTIYLINQYDDKDTIQKYINHFSNKSINDLKVYVSDDIYQPKYLEKVYKYLFEDNNDFYDIYINPPDTDIDELKSILIKITVIKRLYKNIKIEKILKKYLGETKRSRTSSSNKRDKSTSIISKSKSSSFGLTDSSSES